MATLELSDEQIRVRGLEVLLRELGPAGLLRFLKHFEVGRGDYTVERHAWLDQNSLDDLLGELKARRLLKRSD